VGHFEVATGGILWVAIRGQSPSDSIRLADECNKKALTLDPTLSCATANRGQIYLLQGKIEEAITFGRKAIDMAPSLDTNYIIFGMTMDFAGKFDQAIPLIKDAMRLNPFFPARYLRVYGMSCLMADHKEEALASFSQLLERAQKGEIPPLFAHLGLCAVYAKLGKEEAARNHVMEILKINPMFSIEEAKKAYRWKDPEYSEKWLSLVRKAGLPETAPLPLPDKPSIAVLPFENMSGDPEQEFFSDGISEEIITALSKTPKLFVIARNSSFTYKGKPVKVQQVGRELGIKYVLEGSVRKAENRVRVTAQLVDASNGHHIWADRYDRELKDIFALQDDITMKVITALQVELTEGERAGLWAKSTNNLEAYLYFLEGVSYTYEDKWLSEARPLFEKAVALDPQFSSAYGRLAFTYLNDVWWGPSETRSESFKKGVESAKKCVAINDSEGYCHAMLGQFYLMSKQYDQALEEGNKALVLSPNDSWIALWQGMTLRCVGRYEEAVSILQRALRLDILNIKWPLFHLGSAYLLMRQYENAIETYNKALKLDPNIFNAYIGLAVAYSELDRMDEARDAASDLLKLRPNFSVMNFINALPYKNEADKEFFASGLRKAGLPD
jgi:TolB-like protein/Flp pilus assembly protein TadD